MSLKGTGRKMINIPNTNGKDVQVVLIDLDEEKSTAYPPVPLRFHLMKVIKELTENSDSTRVLLVSKKPESQATQEVIQTLKVGGYSGKIIHPGHKDYLRYYNEFYPPEPRKVIDLDKIFGENYSFSPEELTKLIDKTRKERGIPATTPIWVISESKPWFFTTPSYSEENNVFWSPDIARLKINPKFDEIIQLEPIAIAEIPSTEMASSDSTSTSPVTQAPTVSSNNTSNSALSADNSALPKAQALPQEFFAEAPQTDKKEQKTPYSGPIDRLIAFFIRLIASMQSPATANNSTAATAPVTPVATQAATKTTTAAKTTTATNQQQQQTQEQQQQQTTTPTNTNLSSSQS